MDVAGTAAVGETGSAGGSDAGGNLGATRMKNQDFGQAENAQEGIVAAADEEKLIVSAAAIKLFGGLITVALMMFMTMIDSGANVNPARRSQQRNGMGVHFPAGEPICQLKERVFDEEVV